MDMTLVALAAFLLLSRRAKQQSPQRPGQQPQRPRPSLPPEQQWARALAAQATLTPAIAAGLARAAVLRNVGAPNPDNVRAVLNFWDTSRAMAEQHKAPTAKWDDNDLLWYATMSQLKPELLAGSGEKAPTVLRQILADHPGDNDVRTAVDTATWIATGRHLPPPAQRPAP